MVFRIDRYRAGAMPRLQKGPSHPNYEVATSSFVAHEEDVLCNSALKRINQGEGAVRPLSQFTVKKKDRIC